MPINVFCGDRHATIDVADFHFASCEKIDNMACIWAWVTKGGAFYQLRADVEIRLLVELGLYGISYHVEA